MSNSDLVPWERPMLYIPKPQFDVYCSLLFASAPPEEPELGRFPDGALQFGVAEWRTAGDGAMPWALELYRRDHEELLKRYPALPPILDSARGNSLRVFIGEVEAATGLKGFEDNLVLNRWVAADGLPAQRPPPLEVDF